MYCDFFRGRARVFARRRAPSTAASAPAEGELIGTLPGYVP
jgi:hypothetical protein